MPNPKPRPTAGLRRVRSAIGAAFTRARRGPWRVAVAEGSMLPAIEPGDWLLVDPTVRRWPRRGSIVVFREPTSDVLAVKRVAGVPGDTVPFGGGYLHLGPDEAWLTADADPPTAALAGFGAPVDSNRFGPVPLELLVGRAWFRYAPLRRLGPLRRVAPRLARGPESLTADTPPAAGEGAGEGTGEREA